MFKNILYVGDVDVEIALNEESTINTDIMNMPIVLEDNEKAILAEIKEMNPKTVKAKMLGELVNGKFIGGILRKPSLDASIRMLTDDELRYILMY